MRVACRLVFVCAMVLASIASASAQQPDGDILAGQLLVATEDMPDARFAQSVIFMVSHSDEVKKLYILLKLFLRNILLIQIR